MRYNEYEERKYTGKTMIIVPEDDPLQLGPPRKIHKPLFFSSPFLSLPSTASFLLFFFSYPPVFGGRCYPIGQAITSLPLFIPSAAWPPNHLHGCPSHLVGIHGKRGGSPLTLQKECNEKL